MQLMDNLARLAGRALRKIRAGESSLAKNVLGAPETIALHSDSFRHGDALPAVHSDSEGKNTSPSLSWSNLPAGTSELVLLCEDPDIPMRKPFAHWVVYGIAPELVSFPEGVPAGSKPGGSTQGVSATRKDGYLGPHPPKGHGPHHYHFQLFALDAPLKLEPRASRDEVVAKMKGHVLACGDLVGIYER